MEEKPKRTKWKCTTKTSEEVSDIFVSEGKAPKDWILKALEKASEEIRAEGGAMPGEFPGWDKKAWQRLNKKLNSKVEDWMLMCHLSETKADFKNYWSREHLYV